jgi:hypothetical protein
VIGKRSKLSGFPTMMAALINLHIAEQLMRFSPNFSRSLTIKRHY